MARRPKYSDVWIHFDKIIKDSVAFVVCKHCNGAYKFCGNTTNMRYHLTRKHSSPVNYVKTEPEEIILSEEIEVEPLTDAIQYIKQAEKIQPAEEHQLQDAISTGSAASEEPKYPKRKKRKVTSFQEEMLSFLRESRDRDCKLLEEVLEVQKMSAKAIQSMANIITMLVPHSVNNRHDQTQLKGFDSSTVAFSNSAQSSSVFDH